MSWTQSLFGDLTSLEQAVVKTILILATAILAVRFSGRRTVSEMAPHDFVVAVAVGAVVGRTATAARTSWLTGATVLLTLALVHAGLSRLRYLPWVSRAMDPPLRVLVRDGAVDERALRAVAVTRQDLMAALRRQGVPDVADVHLAVFESTGAVSVLRTASADPAASTEPGG